MKLSEVKNRLSNLENIDFELENGAKVPNHFHITEVGMITKKFIDCGGVIRDEKMVNFQLWNANDVEHRLKPAKLLQIIALSETKLGIEDLEVEVEYQSDTIGKYGLNFKSNHFVLTTKQTDCLAKDNCGVPEQKPKIRLSALPLVNESVSCCTPGGGCC